jgi:hypothetical protein
MNALEKFMKTQGGTKGLFKNVLKKIPGLNTILAGLFAINDIKSLLANPVDGEGKPLSKELVNIEVGKIVAGALGGILGGFIGTIVAGGPWGTILGALGGDFLFKKIIEVFPDAAGALGSAITPFFESTPTESTPTESVPSVKGNDIMSFGDNTTGYGKRTLFGPEGAIQLNNKDTVVAGTNLGGGSNSQSVSPSIDLKPLIERMAAVENILTQIFNKEGNVYLDGTKVGTAMAVSTYRVQ